MSYVEHAKIHHHYTFVAYLVASGLVLLYLLHINSTSPLNFELPPLLGGSSSSPTRNVEGDELETALRMSATENGTVIIAVVNRAYVEEGGMLDLFVESFRRGDGTEELLRHVLIAAVDQAAYDRCHLLGLRCYKLVTDGDDFSGEQLFMSAAFLRMMWRRTLFLADVLRRGYSFVFTDTDVMWLRNPFSWLNQHEEDLQISCDRFNGRAVNTSNPINTGFYFVRSSNRTAALFDRWYSERNNATGMKEQDVLDAMISRGVPTQMGIELRFLDTRRFAGFCENSRDLTDVVTLHANCCRTISAKLVDLKVVLDDWGRFKVAGNNGTSPVRWYEQLACRNSWEVGRNQSHA